MTKHVLAFADKDGHLLAGFTSIDAVAEYFGGNLPNECPVLLLPLDPGPTAREKQEAARPKTRLCLGDGVVLRQAFFDPSLVGECGTVESVERNGTVNVRVGKKVYAFVDPDTELELNVPF